MTKSLVKIIAITGILIGISAHKAQANQDLDFECMKYYDSQKINLEGKWNQDKKTYEYYYQNAINNDLLVSIVGRNNFIVYTYRERFSIRPTSRTDNDRFTYHKPSIEFNKYHQAQIEELCRRTPVAPPIENIEPEEPKPQVQNQELRNLMQQVISEEFKKVLPQLQNQSQSQELRELIRQLIAEELQKASPQPQPQTQPR